MHIAWATPFNERSAIGASSHAAVQALRRHGLDIEIVRTETGTAANLPVIETPFLVHAPGSLDFEHLRHAFDATVIALGDNYPFHGRALQMLDAVPSIVVFHDADIRNLIAGSVRAGILSADFVASSRSAHAMPTSNGYAMGADLPWLVAKAVGAVVHAHHYASLVDRYPRVPSIIIPLAKFDPGLPKSTPRADGRFVLTTFGVMNRNKQADRVLRALSATPSLRNRFVYRLIGSITDEERNRLIALADALGLRRPEIHNWVPDDRLQELLGESDAICCLRHPILEGASSSLIFALYSARPTIVADAGSYAEVPDDLVWKVSYGDDAGDVAAALQAIAADRSAARIKALAVREWARRRHSPDNYAAQLMPFIQGCVERSRAGRRPA